MTTIRRSRRAPHARRPNRIEVIGAYKVVGAYYTYQATCSCGWVGPPRSRQSETAGDYRAHRDCR